MKIQELEKQLFEQQDEAYNKEEDLLCKIEDLQKQLAESVPKSEIKRVLFREQVCIGDGYVISVDKFKELLQEKTNNE
jgi:hypothetical protein